MDGCGLKKICFIYRYYHTYLQKFRFEWPKQREGIYKEKKIEISLLSRPAEKRGIRLSPPRGKSASIAFWYQNAACRENPDPNAACGRRKERRAEESIQSAYPAG